VKAVNFDVCKKTKLIGYHNNVLRLLQNLCQLNNPHAYVSTNAEKLMKLGVVCAEIFSGICRFLQLLSSQSLGLLDQTIDQTCIDVVSISPLKIFESEQPYSYPFQNASLPIKGHFVPRIV